MASLPDGQCAMRKMETPQLEPLNGDLWDAQFVSRHPQLVVAFLTDTMVQGSVISPHLLYFLFEPLKGLDSICVQWKQTLIKATL